MHDGARRCTSGIPGSVTVRDGRRASFMGGGLWVTVHESPYDRSLYGVHEIWMYLASHTRAEIIGAGQSRLVAAKPASRYSSNQTFSTTTSTTKTGRRAQLLRAIEAHRPVPCRTPDQLGRAFPHTVAAPTRGQQGNRPRRTKPQVRVRPQKGPRPVSNNSTFAVRARKAALDRLLNLDEDDRQAMTEKARAAKFERYIERLKDVVDPDKTMTDAERTRRAHWLAESRAADAELARARRARNRELISAAEAAFQAEAAS